MTVGAESRSVVVRMSMDVANGVRAARQFGKSISDAANDAERAALRADQAMENVGNTAGKAGLTAAAGLTAVSKIAMDWESQWAGVTKTVDGTTSQLADLEGGLRDLAKSMPATHQEIAAVAEAAGQLGVEREAIVDFTEVMVQLGETTNLTADAAATSIAQMANVMGTAPDEIDNLGAALVALGNDGASTEAQIIEMAQRISSAGALIGLTEADILAVANATASMGIEVEAGGSAISTVFMELAKATKTGGSALDTFASTASMSSAEFVEAFQKDPAQAFAAFTAGLDQINKSGGDVFTLLDDLGLSDIRVSRALLSMAASGDLLTESLSTGAQAWSESSALSDEYAKRAETTAAQVQVSWNNIKDASIDAGAVMLPVIEGVADTVSELAQVFGALPAPVQGTLTSLLGITAVFGGGLWFTSKVIGGVNDMRASLEALGVDANKTKGALGALGKASLIVGATIALKELERELRQMADVDVSSLSRDLEIFGQTGQVTGELVKGFGADLDGAVKSFHADGKSIGETLAYAAEGAGSFIEKLEGYDSSESVLRTRELDDALASLAGTNAPAAADAFERLAKAAKAEGVSRDDLLKVMPQYADELERSEAAAEASAGATDGLTGANSKAAAATEAATAATHDQLEALAEQREAARETASSFVNLGDSLDDSAVSLGGWIAELEAQAAALRDFTKNARTAARRGLNEGLIASLEEAGESGALRLQQLAGASETEIARANRAWRRGQRAIEAYERHKVSPKDIEVRGATRAEKQVANLKATMDSLPPDVASEVRAEGIPRTEAQVDALIEKYPILEKHRDALITLTDQASAKARTIGAVLDAAARDRSSTFTTFYRTVGTPGAGRSDPTLGGLVNPADGGTIPFGGGRPRRAEMGATVPDDGGAYYDRYPYLLAPREEVVSNRVGQADAFRPELKAINAGASRRQVFEMLAERLADGGTVRGLASGGTARRGDNGADGIRELGKAARETAKEMRAAARAERERVRDLKQSLVDGVAGQFRSNIFETDNVWASSGDWRAKLRAETAQANQFARDARVLKSKGVSGGALDYLLSNADPSMVRGFAGMTKSQLAEYSRLYTARERAAAAAGRTAGDAAYGAQLRAIERQLERLNNRVGKNAEETGRAVGREVNGAARNGARRGRR